MSEKGFFDEYFWDIIFAFIFAVVAAVLLEIVARPFRKLYKKFLSEKIQNFIKKVKNRGEETLHEAVILKSINSKFDKEAPSRYIAGAIKRHNSLCQNKRFHYTDISRKYHIYRKFKLLPMLNGAETFFSEMCKVLASQINLSGSSLVLSLEKKANGLFAKEFAQNYPQSKIKSHSLKYKEKRRWFEKKINREYEYEEGESLDETDVILLESLLIFPETILESIKWIQNEGAKVRNVVILFDASGQFTDFISCGLKPENVIIGCFIDLKLSLASNCKCNNESKLNILRYDKY